MEKIRHTAKFHTSGKTNVLMAVLSAAAAFAASFGKILGFPSSMNVAVAVLSGTNVIPAFLGSALAYFVNGTFSEGIVQLCAILVIGAVRLVMPSADHKDDPVFVSLLTTGAMLLFSCVMSVAMPSDTYTASLRMISSLMCGCVVFIALTVKRQRNRSGVFDLTGINGVFTAILYIMFISTITAAPLHVVNLGRIAGTLFMLMAVRKYRNIGGAVVGALTTCGVLLCTPSLARNTLLLATSGLICGAFLQFGSLVIVLVFLAVSLVSLVAMGVNGDTFSMFADLLIGSVLFIALPVPVIKRVAKKVVGVKNSVDLVGQTTSSKLNMASRTLGGIRGQLTMVTAAIDKRSKEATLSKRVRSVVCTDCDMYSVCSKLCVQLDDSFSKLESIVCTYNNLSLDDVEKHLGGCVRKSLLCKSFNELYTDFVAERADSMRVREMREFLSEQLSSMEDILSDLSFRAGQVRSVDPQLSARVREHFSNLGYPNVKVCVYIDENLCQRVDVFITAQFRGDLVRLTATLSEMIDYDLDMPVIVKVDNITRMSFAEIPKFTVDIKSFSASSSGEYSGDSFEVFDSSVNEKYIVLSDGMGTGKRARLDSLFSVSLVTRLIRSGMSMQTAHRLINSMLRVKGWEESFATLDIMRLELNGGTVQFLKSGAAQSFLFRDGGLKAIGGQAFPAGILAECTPDVSELKLFDGDVLLMTSDGVEDATAREILRCNGMNAQEIVTALGAKALAQRTGGRRDDITIIAAKIFLRDENEK